jgi:hypothetical protein
MKGVIDILSGANIWLISLAVGVIVWTVRQVISNGVEETRLWRLLLKVGPLVLGGLLAVIPAIQPQPDNWVASCLWGVLAGSVSQTAYSALRSVVPEKIRALMGSKAQRNSRLPKRPKGE